MEQLRDDTPCPILLRQSMEIDVVRVVGIILHVDASDRRLRRGPEHIDTRAHVRCLAALLDVVMEVADKSTEQVQSYGSNHGVPGFGSL